MNIVGDVSFSGAGNILDGTNIRIFGDAYINGNLAADAVIYVSGNLTLDGNIQETALVVVGQDLYVDGNIETDVYVAGEVTVGGNMLAENLGLDFDNPPFDLSCPLSEIAPATLTYDIQLN